jgi:cytochrome c peroxidase
MRVSRVGSVMLWVLVVAACSQAKRERIDLGPAAASLTKATSAMDAPTQREFNPRLLRRFKPLHVVVSEPTSAGAIELGRMLYFEKRLSKNGSQSCNSCHPLDQYGADGQATSQGHDGTRGTRNSPTVYHAAGYVAQFWDGRAINVEEQAKGPILNPVEMGMRDAAQVENTLKSISGYEAVFHKAFPKDKEPITYDNVGKAIGAFERGLMTPARWDSYLNGDKSALTSAELEGLRVFTNVGCMVCHTGEFVGGSMFEKVGAVEPWPNQKDPGRFSVTKDERDRMVFKVPTLRNIGKTGPYFHDGSAKTLADAVQMMGRHQLGLELSDTEITSIAAWLNSLTGVLPAEYIKAPVLPGLAIAPPSAAPSVKPSGA